MIDNEDLSDHSPDIVELSSDFSSGMKRKKLATLNGFGSTKDDLAPNKKKEKLNARDEFVLIMNANQKTNVAFN